jgi:type IV secretion system protein VirD4
MSGEENRIYWLAGAVVAAVVVAIWLIGALSMTIFGSGAAPLSLYELVSTTLRLPLHFADPRAAWPKGARASLPGPIGFYSTAVLVLSALLGLALAAHRALQRLGLGELISGGRRRPPSARMASKKDLRSLLVASSQPGRLTLGRYKGSLLAAEERQSVIVFAPTQAMKTTGFAIPALLEWEGPVLATTIKNDLLAPTLRRREELGEVMVFDPAHATNGVPRSRATPLWGATSWRGALRVAHWLMEASRLGHSSGLKDADFWAATGTKLLAPLLFAAAKNERTIESVVAWLDEGPEANESEVCELLKKAGVPEAERAWMATVNREERQRASVYTTAEMAMSAFADPKVISETGGADYNPAALLDGSANTLFLCAPKGEQARLRPLFSMVVQELLAVVEELHATTEKPLDPPLLLLLDEAANIAPIPNLDEVASTGAGMGVQLLSIFHDFAQGQVRFGNRFLTTVNNHAAKIVGSGSSDPETTSYFSKIIGTGAFEQRSRTAGEQGRRSTTEGETYRDLAPASVQREAEPGTGHLVYRHLRPTNFSLRPWFEDPILRELQQASPSGSGSRGVL